MPDDEVRIDAKFREPWDEESEELITKAKDAVLRAFSKIGSSQRHKANLVLNGRVHSAECVYASSILLHGTLIFPDRPPSDAIGKIGSTTVDGRDVTVRIRGGSYITNTFDLEELTGA